MSGTGRVRALSYVALGIVYLHLVAGAIVRITGSGMGCGDHWPKCHGQWFPPLDRLDLIIELSHRYLAMIVGLVVLALVVTAWRARDEPGIGGAGGSLRAAVWALGTVVAVSLLGAYTVKQSNAPLPTVAHLVGAMAVLAFLAAAAIRAGGLGGSGALAMAGSKRTMRGAMMAATLVLLAIVFGGLTAKYPGAAVGCLTFPLCDPNPAVDATARGLQLTHRTIAFLLLFHLTATALVMRKRRQSESPPVVRAAMLAASVMLVQLLVAGAMIGMFFPLALRSLHQAVGVLLWLVTFTFAYLAKRAAR